MIASRINTVNWTLAVGSSITEMEVEDVDSAVWHNKSLMEYETRVTPENIWFKTRAEAVAWIRKETERQCQSLYSQIQLYVDIENKYVGE